MSPEGGVTGRVELATGALDTKNSKRDTHLRSDDFFLTEKYPAITFTVDSIAPAGDGVTVSASSPSGSPASPISFPAAVTVAGDDEIVFDATVHVDRSDFGLTWNQLGMASMNTIAIHTVLARG